MHSMYYHRWGTGTGIHKYILGYIYTLSGRDKRKQIESNCGQGWDMRGQRSWVERLTFPYLPFINFEFLKYFNIVHNKYINLKRKGTGTKSTG